MPLCSARPRVVRGHFTFPPTELVIFYHHIVILKHFHTKHRHRQLTLSQLAVADYQFHGSLEMAAQNVDFPFLLCRTFLFVA